MSMRKPSPRFRAVRPSPEALEDRELLSAIVNGTDLNGNKWTLKLEGPGTMNVSLVSPKGPVALTPAMASTPESIDTITISGTNSIHSRLVGTVLKSPTSDGRVFFQNLIETGGGALNQVDPSSPIGRLQAPSVEPGIFSINMPDFWLGNSRGTKPPADTRLSFQLSAGQIPNFAEVGRIDIPDGVTTLQFGGVDTTFTPTGGTSLASTAQNNRFNINLGVPFILGTSVIVNKVITDAASSTSNTGGTPTTTNTQDTVFFNVSGRLNLFQANQIDGNSQIPGTQFSNQALGATTSPLAGGTYVISQDFNQIVSTDQTNNNQQFARQQGVGVTGQIGFVRVGGNASQFTVLATNNPAFGAAGGAPAIEATISNFFIGGETNNVLLLTDGGARNVYFGKGMDLTKINTNVISNLQANRGALNSTVTVQRGVDQFVSGGDVVNTNVQAGYNQNLESTGATVEIGEPVPTIINRQPNNSGTFFPTPTNGGQINARIAGDVISSVFSAGVEPDPNYAIANAPGVISRPTSQVFPFGEPDNIILPHNIINAKVEGKIDNSAIVSSNGANIPGQVSVAPGQANQAFFAKVVNAKVGPVIPPNVAEAPFPKTVYHRGQRGILPSGPVASKSTTGA